MDVVRELVRLARSLTAAKLKMGHGKLDHKATQSLSKMKLRARGKGDLSSSIVSAAYHAKKHDTTYYVYPGNYRGNAVWRVTYKLNEALDPVNNNISMTEGREGKMVSVEPDLQVYWHEVQA